MRRKASSDRNSRAISSPAHPGLMRSAKPSANFMKRNSGWRGAPHLAGGNRHGSGQRAGADDLAGSERRVERVARQQTYKVAQRRERAAQHVFGMTPVDQPAVAIQLDLECRQRRAAIPLRAAQTDGAARSGAPRARRWRQSYQPRKISTPERSTARSRSRVRPIRCMTTRPSRPSVPRAQPKGRT